MKQAEEADGRPEVHPSDQATEETAGPVAEAAPGHCGWTEFYQQPLQPPYYTYIEHLQSEPIHALDLRTSLAEIPSSGVFPIGNVSRGSELEAPVGAENQVRLMTTEASRGRPPELRTSTSQGDTKLPDSYDDTKYALAATTVAGATFERTPAANLSLESFVDARNTVTSAVRHQSQFTSPQRAQPYPQRVRQQPNTAVRFTATARNIPATILAEPHPTPPPVPYSADVWHTAQGNPLEEPQGLYPLPTTTTRQYEIAPTQNTWSVGEVEENQNAQLPSWPDQVQHSGLSLPGIMQHPMYPSVPNRASLWYTGHGLQLGHPESLNFVRPPAIPLYDPAFSQRTPSFIERLPPPLNPDLHFIPVYNNNPVMTGVGRYPAPPPHPSGHWHAPQGSHLGPPLIPVYSTAPPSIMVTPPSPEFSLKPVPQPAVVSQQAEQQHAGYRTPYFQMVPARVSATGTRPGPLPGASLQPVPQTATLSQQAKQQPAGYGTPYRQMTPSCVSKTDPRTGPPPGDISKPAPQPAMVSQQAKQQHAGNRTPYFRKAPAHVSGTGPRPGPLPGASSQPVPQTAMLSQQAEQERAGYRSPYSQMAPPCESGTDPPHAQHATSLPSTHPTGRETVSQAMKALQEYQTRCLRIRKDMLERTCSILRQLRDGDAAHSQAQATVSPSTQSTAEHVISQVMEVIDDYRFRERRLSEMLFNSMSSFVKSIEDSLQLHPTATTDVAHTSSRSRRRAARCKNRLYTTDVPRRFACKEELREQRAATASTVATCDDHSSDSPEKTPERATLVSSMARLFLQPPQEHLPNPEEQTPGLPRPVNTGSAYGVTSGSGRLKEFQRLCPSNPEAEEDDTVVCQSDVSAERPQPQRGRGRGRSSQD